MLCMAGGLLAAAVMAAPPDDAALDAYIRSLRRTPTGYVDVAALDLPDDFLRRAAGRSVRLRFRQQFRQGIEEPAAVPTAPPAPAGAMVTTVEVAPAVVDAWRRFEARPPGLRGFRAPLGEPAAAWSMDAPSAERAAEHRAAATYVARHLATDGLVATTMQVMRHVKLDWLTPDGARLDERTLRAVGIPVDLLSMFRLPDRGAADAIAAWYGYGAPGGSIPLTRNEAVFRFRPSRPGFAVAPQDGTVPLGAVRLQVSRGGFERGPGDGSALDLVRQLVDVSDARVWISVHEADVAAVVGALAVPEGRVVAVPTPLPVSTWAGDGAVIGRDGDGRGAVTLVPRFASGGETTTRFVPGDSFVFETAGAVVGDVVQSCLLFQGGNLLPVVDPVTGASILLVGEREVHRNRALGLTRDQALEAFRVEFGVDRCEVLPAISFHLDMEMTVRNLGGALVACLPDETAAARLVVEAGVVALARRGAIAPARMERVLADLRGDAPLAAIAALNGVIADYTDPQGRTTALFTSMFATGPVESGAGNALRLLVAMDILAADAIAPAPMEQLSDENRRYLLTMQERAEQRDALEVRLQALGIRVARVPAMSDEEASLNALNGIHTPGAYLMPAYGGLYAGVDDAAAEALGRAFGPGVEIRPVRSAALQRAYGGLRGAASVYPGASARPD